MNPISAIEIATRELSHRDRRFPIVWLVFAAMAALMYIGLGVMLYGTSPLS